MVDKVDPYVRAKVGSQVFQTQVVKNTESPEWNETHDFLVHSMEQLLRLQVWDKDRVPGMGNRLAHALDNHLGTATFNILGLVDPEPKARWKNHWAKVVGSEGRICVHAQLLTAVRGLMPEGSGTVQAPQQGALVAVLVDQALGIQTRGHGYRSARVRSTIGKQQQSTMAKPLWRTLIDTEPAPMAPASPVSFDDDDGAESSRFCSTSLVEDTWASFCNVLKDVGEAVITPRTKPDPNPRWEQALEFILPPEDWGQPLVLEVVDDKGTVLGHCEYDLGPLADGRSGRLELPLQGKSTEGAVLKVTLQVFRLQPVTADEMPVSGDLQTPFEVTFCNGRIANAIACTNSVLEWDNGDWWSNGPPNGSLVGKWVDTEGNPVRVSAARIAGPDNSWYPACVRQLSACCPPPFQVQFVDGRRLRAIVVEDRVLTFDNGQRWVDGPPDGRVIGEWTDDGGARVRVAATQVHGPVARGYPARIYQRAEPHTHSVMWLSKCIAQLWPSVDEVVRRLVKQELVPLVQEYLPLDFQCTNWTLGTAPLELSNLAVSTGPTGHVRLTTHVCFGGTVSDQDVTFTVGGMEIGVSRLQVSGDVTLSMGPLIDRMPVVGGLQVFLENEPHLDMDFQGMADVLDLPLVSYAVRRALQYFLGSAMVLPNRLTFLLAEHICPSEVLFWNAYEPPCGVLHVTVNEAKGLKNSDGWLLTKLGFASSDPYCILRLGNGAASEFRTSTKMHNLHPVWEESHRWFVWSKGQRLRVDMYDYDYGTADDLLGTADMEVKEVIAGSKTPRDRAETEACTGEAVELWQPLSNDAGHLRLTCIWAPVLHRPSEGQRSAVAAGAPVLLTVLVGKARAMVSRIGGLRDALCQCTVDGEVQSTHSVPLAAGPLGQVPPDEPDWQQGLEFYVANIRAKTLLVDVVAGGQTVGSCRVSLRVLLQHPDYRVHGVFSLQGLSGSGVGLCLALRVLG